MCNNLRPGLSGALRRGGSGNGGRRPNQLNKRCPDEEFKT